MRYRDRWPEFYDPIGIDKKSFLIKVGKNLKAIRLGRSLSLQQVSIRCDIDHSKISKIEKGQVNITIVTLILLTKALKTTPDIVLNFECSTKYERGDNSLCIDEIAKLAKSLNVSVPYLLKEGLNAAYDKQMIKRMDELENLPVDEKQRIFHYMDLIVRDHKTNKTYNLK